MIVRLPHERGRFRYHEIDQSLDRPRKWTRQLRHRSIYQHDILMRADMFSVLAIKRSWRARPNLTRIEGGITYQLTGDDPQADHKIGSMQPTRVQRPLHRGQNH